MSGAISAATVFSAVGAAGSLLGALSGGKSSSPAPAVVAPPAVEPVTAMPTPKNDTAKAAERASIAEQMRRRGRASTILTDVAASDTLG